MTEQLEMSVTLSAPPQVVYAAWLDSTGHSRLTGSPASVDARVGGAFTAWDGYITGTTLALEPFQRILQAWRTSEFPEEAPDARLEILLQPADGGTLLTLRHTLIPAGQAEQYREGWQDFYFTPMQEYFK